MPKLTEATAAARKLQAVRAEQLQILNPELSVASACELAGISIDQYYRWLDDSDTQIRDYRTFLMGAMRHEFAEIALSLEMITAKLLQDALRDTTGASDRLAIKRYLDERFRHLADYNQVRSDDKAAEFLLGPELESAESRMLPTTTTTVTVNTNGEVVVQRTETIDGHLKDIPEEDTTVPATWK